MSVGVMVVKILHHRLRHQSGYLRTARPVKVRDWVMFMNAFQGREVAPNFAYRRYFGGLDLGGCGGVHEF